MMAHSSMIPNTRVPCTFDDCRFYFKSVEEMKRHKSKAPEHEYCKKCDLDFPDEEHHLVHKIKSTKHVACPMCGEDFKSEGGRDAHIRQTHRADQDITCVGCTAKFVRAGALMAHIENNQCEVITGELYAQERAKKTVLKEAVAQVLKSDGVVSGTSKIGSEVASEDGGVPVDPLSLLDDVNSQLPGPGGSQGKPRGVASMTSRKHWPTLGSDRSSNRGGNKDEEIEEDLMAFSTLSVHQGEYDHPGAEAQGKRTAVLSESLIGRELPASGIPTNFGLDRDSGEMTSSRANNGWDPNRFFDPCLGLYTCSCKGEFKTLSDFETHLASGAHAQGRIRCPACYRIFKTHAALVSHCETASVKCRISQSNNFNNIIQDISGGVVEASGHHNDGTVRYEAGQIVNARKAPSSTKIKW